MHSVQTMRDLRYAVHGGIELRFDLHVPAQHDGALPLALFLHGGGWLRGARTDFETERQLCVAHAGLAVATLDYRLSGQARWPAQLDDVRTALDAIPGLVCEAGVELNGRTALWGCSAGGHLALMAALTAQGGGFAEPDAVVAWFAPTDLTLMSNAPAPPAARMPDFMAGRPLPDFERHLLGLAAGADDRNAKLSASPITHVHGGAAPILLVHGDEDALIPPYHSLSLHDAIAAAGGSVQTLIVHGASHEDPLFDTPSVLGTTANALLGVE